jgi:hypothetical protein
MNRRGFFKLSALAGIGLFLPKTFDPARWKMLGPSGLIVPNPAYVNAPFQLITEWSQIGPEGYWSVPLKLWGDLHKPELNDPNRAYPFRYALTDPDTHKPVCIPPFIRSELLPKETSKG